MILLYNKTAIKIDNAIEYSLEEHYEDAFDNLIDVQELYDFIEAWNKKQKIAKTWVADCGDPYVGVKTDSFRKWFYWSWVEKWFMKKADFIAITNINFKINYFPEFHKKMVEIPQGFNFDEVNYINGEILFSNTLRDTLSKLKK